MGTSIKKSLTYGKNYSFDVKARGYYDYLETKSITKETEDPINITLKEYDGLKYTVDKSSDKGVRLNFANTVLPYISDNKLQKTDYCLANVGTSVEFGTNDIVDGCLDTDLTYSSGDVEYNCFANKNINICLTDKETYNDYRYLGTVKISGSDKYLIYDYTELKIPVDIDISKITGAIKARDITLMTYEDESQTPTSYSLLKSEDGINFTEIDNNITVTNTYNSIKQITILNIYAMFNYNGKYFLKCNVHYPNSSGGNVRTTLFVSTEDFETVTILNEYSNSEGFFLYDGKFVRTKGSSFEVSTDLGKTWGSYSIKDKDSPLYDKSIEMFISNDTIFIYNNSYFYKLSSLTFNNAVIVDNIVETPAQAVATVSLQISNVDYNNKYIADDYAIIASSSTKNNFIDLFTGEILFTLKNIAMWDKFLGKYNDNYIFYDALQAKIINQDNEVLSNYRGESASYNDSIIKIFEYDKTTNKKDYKALIKVGIIEVDNSDPSTKLMLGDRIDNKATVIGNFTDSNNQEYVVAVLDASYHGSSLAFSNEAIDSVLPNYKTYDLAVAAKESATYNMNQIETNYDITTYPAFNHCKTCTTVTFNKKEYTPLLPNAAEVEMINTNWSLVQGTTSTKMTQCWSSNEKHTYAWRRTADAWFNSLKTKAEYAAIPIIEIPVVRIPTTNTNDSIGGTTVKPSE